MIYNREWLDALTIKAEAKKLAKLKLISEAQLASINARYIENFYSPATFVRVGLFIFTLFLAFSAFGLLAIPFIGTVDNEFTAAILLLIASIPCFILLERFIKTKHHLRSGIDDALLYFSLGLVISAVAIFIFKFESIIAFLFFLQIILTFSAYRYLNDLLTFCSFVCMLVLTFFVLTENSIKWGKIIMPFVFMVISGIIAYLAHQRINYKFRHWKSQLIVLKICGLLAFYLSGIILLFVKEIK